MPRFGTELLARARSIRAVVLDVDGVLTDSSLYYGPKGEALKRFSARGTAMATAKNEGLWIAILSGRVAPPLKARLADLGVLPGLVIEGSRDERAGRRDPRRSSSRPTSPRSPSWATTFPTCRPSPWSASQRARSATW